MGFPWACGEGFKFTWIGDVKVGIDQVGSGWERFRGPCRRDLAHVGFPSVNKSLNIGEEGRFAVGVTDDEQVEEVCGRGVVCFAPYPGVRVAVEFRVGS